MQIYRFGNFSLNVTERRIAKNGQFLKLSPKTFDILVLLIKRKGEVVSKDEILGTVWNGRIVEEGNLAVHISKLRKLLHSDDENSFIETVSGDGYRFIGNLTEESIDGAGFQTDSASAPNLSALFGNTKFRSIAVLPIENQSGEAEHDYVADGITESIINSLTRMSRLRVIAANTMFRFRGKNVKIHEISRELNVDLVLTGRIRIVNETIVTSVELVNPKDESQIAGAQSSEPFGDVFYSASSVDEILSKLSKFNSKRSIGVIDAAEKKVDPESHNLYLKGMYLLKQRSSLHAEQAIAWFEQSVAVDSKNALAYVGLADAYRSHFSNEQISRDVALTKIRYFLRRALEIDADLPEVYSAIGTTSLFFDIDFDAAERNLKIAITMNPNSAEINYRYALLLAYSDRPTESVRYLKVHDSMDPVSMAGFKQSARVYYVLRLYDMAIFKLNQCVELEPDDIEVQMLLGACLTETQNFKEALGHFETSLSMQTYIPTIAYAGYAQALLGDRVGAFQRIDQLHELAKTEIVSPINFATVFSGLRNSRMTFKWLEEAFKIGNIDLAGAYCDPRWGFFRNDRKFIQILRNNGLFFAEHLK